MFCCGWNEAGKVQRIPANLEIKLGELVREYGWDLTEECLDKLRPSQPILQKPFSIASTNAAFVTKDSHHPHHDDDHHDDDDVYWNNSIDAHAVLEASPDGVIVSNLQGTIVAVNHVAVRMLGYQSAQDLTRKALSAVGLNNIDPNKLAKKNNIQQELRLPRKDQGELHCTFDLSLFENSKYYIGFLREITHDQLHERNVLSAIFESSFDALFVIDRVGVIQRINVAALKVFGYNLKDELVGKDINIIVGRKHAENHGSYLANFNRTGIKKMIGTQREVTARRKDGSEFPCHLGLSLVEEGTESALVVGFIRDLSQEKALAHEKHIFSAIVESSFDPMFVTDKVGVIQMVNEATLKVFGYEKKEELVGNNISMVVGKDYAANHDRYMSNYNKTGIKKIIGTQREVSARRKDGSEFPCQLGLSTVEEGTESSLVVGFIRDISKEKALVHEMHVTKSIMNASFDPVFITDTHGKIEDVNNAALTVFGYDAKKELIGMNISVIVGKEHAHNHDKYLKSFNKTGIRKMIGTQREVMARRKDGTEFPCHLGLSVVEEGSNGSLFVGFIQDMTQQKKVLELEFENRLTEELLVNMLPQPIIARLKRDPSYIADHNESATILFADIVGFTSMSAKLQPIEVVSFLNDIFSRFDKLTEEYSLNKVKTIGDCYMVTSIPMKDADENHYNRCAAVCHFALDMIDELNDYNANNPERPLNLRIGINMGPVVSGVVGTKRFLFDIWGDAVNLASRMESTGIPGRIQVTKSLAEFLNDEFEFEARGTVSVKGKGEMETFLLKSRIRPKRISVKMANAL